MREARNDLNRQPSKSNDISCLVNHIGLTLSVSRNAQCRELDSRGGRHMKFNWLTHISPEDPNLRFLDFCTIS
eukprot:1936978-Pleurochrysis_carterae.AAC.6